MAKLKRTKKQARTTRTPQIKWIPYKLYDYEGSPLKPGVLASIEMSLAAPSFQLPKEYRNFLLRRNGGTPRDCFVRWNHPRHGELAWPITYFTGINPAPFAPGRSVDLIEETLRSRHMLPPQFVPIATVLDDHSHLLLGIDENERSHGQVWLFDDESYDDEIDNEQHWSDYIFFVADSFNQLLGMLTEQDPFEYEHAVSNAIIEQRAPDQRTVEALIPIAGTLERLLRALLKFDSYRFIKITTPRGAAVKRRTLEQAAKGSSGVNPLPWIVSYTDPTRS